MAAFAKSVLLAETYDEEMDPTGWWVSEKLDGVRAYWNGSNFYSRAGNLFYAPKSFTKDLPKCALDGELWCGRGLFQKCVSIVKTKKNVSEEDWKYVTYLVFDAPDQPGPYEDRVKYMKSIINPQKKTTFAAVVGIKKCDGPEHLQKCLDEVIKLGGEGLMLRKPGSKYAHGRSNTLLKVKTFHDEEAKVIGYEKGEGRLAGMMGAIKCVLTNGVEFKIGTGFSDEQRRKPPKIGSIVTFKYQELSNDGNPRFPAYLRERTDVTWADVVESAKTKPPFSTKKKVVPTLKKQHTIMFSTVPSLDPETGDKVVTEDDVHDDGGNDSNDETDASKTNTKAAGNAKPACKYGAACYQNNAVHLANFTHPPKPQAVATPAAPKAANNNKKKAAPKDEEENSQGNSVNNTNINNTNTDAQKTPCKFGAACYQTSAFHLSRYSHPPKGTPVDEGEKLTQEEIKEFKGLDDEDDKDSAQEETVTISKREFEDLKFQLQASEERVAKLEEIIKTIRGSVSDVDTNKGTSGDKKRKLDQSAEMPAQKKSKPNSIL